MFLTIQPSQLTLALYNETQLCYVLLTVHPEKRDRVRRTINWTLVADASLSMRIPILSEDQFRQLVLQGGAQEVLVDGVPVWRLTNPLSKEMKDDAPSALDYVARALHSVVEQLDDRDHFTLVACAEKALILVPAKRGDERVELVRGIDQLKHLDLGTETDLATGLHLALALLQSEQNEDSVERWLLLTDGFTLRSDECLMLAQQAATHGIAMSTIGLGTDFQDDLLTGLADVSGGRALFLQRADEIPLAVTAELESTRAVVAPSVILTLKLSQHVSIRRATRIKPQLTALPIDQTHPRLSLLKLGELERDVPIRVLLEMIVPPLHTFKANERGNTGKPYQAHHAHSEWQLRLAEVFLTTGKSSTLQQPIATHDLLATYTHHPQPMQADMMDAVARAHVVYLQRTALEAAAAGDHARASALLRTIGQRLVDLGEHELAAIAMREAYALEQTGKTTRLGAKELTYATRRLGT